MQNCHWGNSKIERKNEICKCILRYEGVASSLNISTRFSGIFGERLCTQISKI